MGLVDFARLDVLQLFDHLAAAETHHVDEVALVAVLHDHLALS